MEQYRKRVQDQINSVAAESLVDKRNANFQESTRKRKILQDQQANRMKKHNKETKNFEVVSILIPSNLRGTFGGSRAICVIVEVTEHLLLRLATAQYVIDKCFQRGDVAFVGSNDSLQLFGLDLALREWRSMAKATFSTAVQKSDQQRDGANARVIAHQSDAIVSARILTAQSAATLVGIVTIVFE